MHLLPALLQRGLRVIDLSADYRLRDPNVYAQWYGESHEDLANLTQAVYGLPEIYGDEIATAQLVANPGCYPQTAILGLAPLVAGKYLEPGSIVIDSKSGVSGAGRTPKLNTHFPECNESVAAYAVGKHRHTPEIEQALSDVAGEPVEVLFTPHLIPMDRGIFSTIYATPRRPLAETQLLDLYREYYRKAPFVRIVDHLPATKDCSGTNFLDVTRARGARPRSSCWPARTIWCAGPAASRCRTSTACTATTNARPCCDVRGRRVRPAAGMVYRHVYGLNLPPFSPRSISPLAGETAFRRFDL